MSTADDHQVLERVRGTAVTDLAQVMYLSATVAAAVAAS